MADFPGRLFVILYALFSCLASAAQDGRTISAGNLDRLRSVARIDFAEFPGELEIGWFEANDDASEFIVFDSDGNIYRAGKSGVLESWSYRGDEAQIFSLIDAVYVNDRPFILYLLDDVYFINDRQLQMDDFPVAVYKVDQSLFVEAITNSGATVFHEVSLEMGADTISPVRTLKLPGSDSDALGMLIGRIDFPHVVLSNLAESRLSLYRYPDAFSAESRGEFVLTGGPAVAGALNSAGSHFAWSDPASARLNLLDLASGENAVVAESGGSYAQYHLLATDASAILVVNVDFAPVVFAWDIETGRRHDLGEYRECTRIPDKVVLSGDGTTLIIGCDTGLDVWRVVDDEET
ncbi:MAG: hypothetical protein OXG78_12475 [Chloroflexi bacterium]|nr:hypothetical protein [Chloroflexota bacterium]